MTTGQEPDACALQAAMSGGQVPRTLDRRGRIELIGELAQALLRGEMPDREGALFLGSALLAWLENGGDLAKDYFAITRPKSHMTIQRLWKQIQDEQGSHRR